MGLFMSQPDTVNSRGDVLTDQMKKYLYGYQEIAGGEKHPGVSSRDPKRAAEMLYNWMTAGGPPKALSPGEVFGESSRTSGVRAKASAGAGINGLFGIGNLIGDLTPKIEPIQPVKMIEPLNQSPMQTGVPYSVPPVAGPKR